MPRAIPQIAQIPGLQAALDARALAALTINGYALSGNITLAKSDIGLGNCDNTSDAAKPVSTAVQTALDLKAALASPAFTGLLSHNSGTLTSSGTPGINLLQTWNGGAYAFTGISFGITDANSDYSSYLLNIAVDSTPRFSVWKQGALAVNGANVTTDRPAGSFSQAWNNSGINFTALKVAVTNMASGSSSLLADFQFGGISQFSVGKDGKVGMTTSGSGKFVWQQHDTYGFGLKNPSGNWVFAAQDDGGIAALSCYAGSTGRLAFKSTTFSANAVWQNQSIGFERVSDTKVKITQSGGSHGDLKLRELFDTNDARLLTTRLSAVADVAAADAADLAEVLTLANETKAKLNTLLARFRATGGHGLIAD